jgi:hypothetical protein
MKTAKEVCEEFQAADSNMVASFNEQFLGAAPPIESQLQFTNVRLMNTIKLVFALAMVIDGPLELPSKKILCGWNGCTKELGHLGTHAG